jgi:hypothetical protein
MRWLGSKPGGKTDAWQCANDDDEGCRARVTDCLRHVGITRRCGCAAGCVRAPAVCKVEGARSRTSSSMTTGMARTRGRGR